LRELELFPRIVSLEELFEAGADSDDYHRNKCKSPGPEEEIFVEFFCESRDQHSNGSD
jgi:hypothetical protein